MRHVSQHSGKHMIWRHGAQHLTAGRYIISIDQDQRSCASLTEELMLCCTTRTAWCILEQMIACSKAGTCVSLTHHPYLSTGQPTDLIGSNKWLSIRACRM